MEIKFIMKIAKFMKYHRLLIIYVSLSFTLIAGKSADFTDVLAVKDNATHNLTLLSQSSLTSSRQYQDSSADLQTIPRLSDWDTGSLAFSHGASGEWDYILWGGFANSLIKKDDTYYLYYQGSASYNNQCDSVSNRAIGVATSTDGIHWAKSPNNPVISWSSRGSIEEGAASSAAWLGTDGKIYIYYGANTGTGCSVNSSARLAVSEDGFNFQDMGEVLSGSNPNVWGSGDELFPVGAYSYNNQWNLYYIPNGVALSRKLGVAIGSSPTTFTQTIGLNNSTIPAWGPVSIILNGSNSVLITNPNDGSESIDLYRFDAINPALIQLHDSYPLPNCTQPSVIFESSTLHWMMSCRDNNSENYYIKNACSPPAISGNTSVAGVRLNYEDGTQQSSTSQADGSYSFLVSRNWSGTVTPSHTCYTFNPENRTYGDVTNNQTSQNYSPTLNVSIGGIHQGQFGIPVGMSTNGRYSNLLNEPVKVISTNAQNIITSQRAYYLNSFNEMMGYPADQFVTEYWFPWYDQVNMATWILVGNPSSTQTAYVDIYIAGVLQGSYAIPPNRRETPPYDVSNGPVRVVSKSGAGTPVAIPIFTSERSLYGPSFNEMMGYPADQLTTEYWFTWYDTVWMNTDIYMSKP
jgi:hypothetical protein